VRPAHAPQTIIYRDIVRRIVLPASGELRRNELPVVTLDRFSRPRPNAATPVDDTPACSERLECPGAVWNGVY